MSLSEIELCLIRDALKRANKLGAKNVEVVGYAEVGLATQFDEILLIVQQPKLSTASDLEWYELVTP